tara:strand:+ start:374 stop:1762 length:1389 start_codon:yes stop_codon:yes gene_type:complete
MNKLLSNKRDTTIKKLIIDVASCDFSRRHGPHEIIEFKVNWHYRDPKLYFHIIKAIVFFIIKSRKLSNILNYSIEGVNIGLPAYSTAVRHFKVYDSKIYLYYSVFKQLISAVRTYFFSTKIIQQSQKNSGELVVYLDEIAYLNSVFFDSLMKGGVGVYANKYPHGYMFYKNKKLTTLSVAKYEYPKIIAPDEKYHAYMEKRLRSPGEFIPYFHANTTKKIKTHKPKVASAQTILIYAHSFTDAQLVYGYDGFLNMYEWLEFTLNTLTNQNVNIIVKGHPNFWGNYYETEVMEWDRKLWNKIKNTYKESKNITFINFPITNKEQLDLLDPKKTVVISHHGNAAVEAAYLGFKSISSSCTPWGNEYYSFCDTWSTREQYNELLCNLENTRFADVVKVKNFVSDRYIYKSSYHGKLVWFSILANEIGVSTKEIITAPSIVTKDKFTDYEHSVRKISLSIHELPDT